jgi:hypothetical protein
MAEAPTPSRSATSASTGRPGWPRPSPRCRWSSSSAGRSTTSPGDDGPTQGGGAAARLHRRRPVRAAVRAHPGHRLDRRPARPALHRPRLDRARAALRGDAGWLTWTGSISLPMAVRVAALLGVARAFAMPALQALAPNLVPREILPRAIALSSIAWQSGAIAGPRSAAISTPGRRHALCGQRRPVRLVPVLHVHDRADRAQRDRGFAQPVAADGRRPPLCPPQPAGARRHLARPVRGPARRRDGDAARLRPRHIACRADRARPSARGAGGRRDSDRPLFLVPAAEARCRGEDAGRRRPCSAPRRSPSACRAG